MFPSRLILGMVLCAAMALARHTLNTAEDNTLTAWLATHLEYRAATNADCNCAEDLRMVQTGWGGVRAVPDYHPYRVAGDFNRDGSEDIAVVVVTQTPRIHGFALLVFNGGKKGAGLSLAFSKTGLDLQGQGLFFGPPAGGNLLLLGPFYSDAGFVVEPKKDTYALIRPQF
jgi:hypothetical protein